MISKLKLVLKALVDFICGGWAASDFDADCIGASCDITWLIPTNIQPTTGLLLLAQGHSVVLKAGVVTQNISLGINCSPYMILTRKK